MRIHQAETRHVHSLYIWFEWEILNVSLQEMLPQFSPGRAYDPVNFNSGDNRQATACGQVRSLIFLKRDLASHIVCSL